MIINYDYYRIFYYVAKYKNLTLAANAIMSNQPNITRSIKNLESALGCTLFIRSNRGVSLTPEGEKLFSHVSVAFDQIQAGEEELSYVKGLKDGIVTVGTSETALHGLLLPVLNKFHNTYPGIKIRISNHSTPQAISALNNGTVDFAVVTTPTNAKNTITEISLKEFREIPVCGLSLSPLSKKVITLKDFCKYPIISLNRDTKSFEFYNDLFIKQGLSFRPDIEVATSDQILPIVKSNLGIGFLPEVFANEAIAKGEIYKLQLNIEIPKRDICILKRNDHTLSIAARELEKQILGYK